MPVAARIEGSVLGADGVPFHKAFVYVHDADDRQVGWAVTDKDGAFHFDVVPGRPLRVDAQPTEPSDDSPIGVNPVGTKADGAQLHDVVAPISGLALRFPAHSGGR